MSGIPAVTRRELMAVAAAGGMASLAGCEHEQGPEMEGIPISREPGWTAQYGSRVSIYKPEGDETRHVVERTNTQLHYLDSNWVNVGNPQGPPQAGSDDQPDGAWKHTFVLSSASFGLERTEQDGRYLEDWHVSDEIQVNPGGFWIDTHPGSSEGDSGWSLDERHTDPVAVSVRRDPDLYGFLDPVDFEDQLRDADQEVRNELARNPEGVSTTNVTRTKARIEEQNAQVSLGITIVSLVIGAGVSLSFLPGFLLGAGFVALDWALTGFDLVENEYRSQVPYNYGISNEQPTERVTAAAGQYITFDVYVAPDETDEGSVGKFTVGSRQRFDPAWKVRIDRSKPKDQLTDSESSDGTSVPSSETFTAEIEDANFNDARNTRKEDQSAGEARTRKPRPQPGIAGPLKNVPSGESVEYSANQTMLAGSHIEEYRWRTYPLSDGVWKQYQRDVISAGTGVEIESLTDRVSQEGEFRGEFPEIEFEQSGRYVLELEVEDGNARNEPGTDGVVGRTFEFVDVNTKAPDPAITLRTDESEDDGATLSAEETTDPDNDLSELDYEWIIAGPLPEEVAELSSGDVTDLPSLNLFYVLSLLREVQATSQTATGREVSLSDFDTDEGVYVALLTATDPSGAWGRTVRVFDGAGCEQFDEDVDVPYVTTGELSKRRELDQYVLELRGELWGDDVTISVEGREEDDLDLYVTLDGRTPTLVDYDRKSSIEGSEGTVELTAPNTKITEMGIAVGLYDGDCGAYRLTVDGGSGGELRPREE